MASYSETGFPVFQAIGPNGPLAGYELYTYITQTTTPQTTWQDPNGDTPNTNPIILDSNGMATVFLQQNINYKFVLVNPATSATFTTIDPVIPVFNPTTGVFTAAGNIQIGNFSITDENANTYIAFTTTANAVNGFSITNAATGTGPVIAAIGSDTNVAFNIVSKGSKHVTITGGLQSLDGKGWYDTNGALILDQSTPGGVIVNNPVVVNSITGVAPGFTVEGSDGNIDLSLTGKGSGLPSAPSGMRINGVALTGGAGGANLSPITSSGTAAAWGNPNNISGCIISGTPSAGHVPIASSATVGAWGLPTGSGSSGGQNLLVNGMFNIWQAGTSVIPSSNAPYGPDRFQCSTSISHGNAYTFSQQSDVNGFNYLRIANSTVGSASDFANISYTFTKEESSRINEMVRSLGGTPNIIMSFLMRGSSAFTESAGIATFYGAANASGESAFQAPSTGNENANWEPPGNLTGLGVAAATEPTLSTSWQQYYMVASIVPDVTSLSSVLVNQFAFLWSFGFFGSGNHVDVRDMKVEISSGNTPSAFNDMSDAHTLAECQRWYATSFLPGTTPAQNAGTGTNEVLFAAAQAAALTDATFIEFPVTMRAAPSITTFSPAASSAQPYDETASAATTSVSTAPTTQGMFLKCTGATGTAIGNKIGVHYVADARLV
jgi:hypothetical protein